MRLSNQIAVAINISRRMLAQHFADFGAMTALLDDLCAASGVSPLGTKEDEMARACVGGKLLILRSDSIEVLPEKFER